MVDTLKEKSIFFVSTSLYFIVEVGWILKIKELGEVSTMLDSNYSKQT